MFSSGHTVTQTQRFTLWPADASEWRLMEYFTVFIRPLKFTATPEDNKESRRRSGWFSWPLGAEVTVCRGGGAAPHEWHPQGRRDSPVFTLKMLCYCGRETAAALDTTAESHLNTATLQHSCLITWQVSMEGFLHCIVGYRTVFYIVCVYCTLQEWWYSFLNTHTFYFSKGRSH